MSSDPKRRIVVGVTGASGAVYGIRLLEALRGNDLEVHLVMSKPAERTIIEETDKSLQYVRELADVVHSVSNIGASIASGSFKSEGMVVAPCSIRTVSAIAYCLADNLLTRAADVILKERRKLVLLVRETPLHTGHLKALLQASESGALIMPPLPAFYSRPTSLDDIINHTVGRILDVFGIEHRLVKRWEGSNLQSRAN
jgi:4-hydroxy-3-polyprenylbenzoate decarboxylase